MTETHLIFFPPSPDRGAAIEAGFRFGHIGTHTSRTMMLVELAAVLAAVPAQEKPPAYALFRGCASCTLLTFP
jgi:hypothetical protein